MPGLPCSYGEVTRLDLPLPFFLRDEAFGEFKNENYNWNASNKVTLLVKKNKKAPVKFTPQPLSEEDVSMGGCPLECPFDPHENFPDAVKHVLPPQTFAGLDFSLDLYDSMNLQSCRELVKKIYDGDEETVQNLCLDRVAGKLTCTNPIYVACDGSPNAKDLVMIGFDKEKFLELRMMGPYKRQSTQLNLELFLAYHQHLPNVNPTSISRHVHAVYEKVHGDFPANGKVFIEFLWSDPKVLFESPPPLNSQVKLAVIPKQGDANKNLKKLWSEIEALDQLSSLSYQSSELNASFHSFVGGDKEKPSAEAIKHLLSQPSAPSWKKEMGYSDSLEVVLERVSNLDRSDLDFTDRVWNILKDTSSIVEIMECYGLIFNAIESNVYRPYFFPSNMTIFSKVVQDRKTVEGNNFKANFTQGLALEMTLDLGLHKLFKDYSFILGTCHLAEKVDTKVFVPRKGNLPDSLNNIKKLHCMLEVLCLSKERLFLTMNEQEAQARALINYLQNNKLDWNHTFHFNITMESIASILNGLHPVYWNLKLESSTELRISRTNAILSRDFFVGHAKKFYVSQDGNIPRGYYLYVHRIAQRKM